MGFLIVIELEVLFKQLSFTEPIDQFGLVKARTNAAEYKCVSCYRVLHVTKRLESGVPHQRTLHTMNPAIAHKKER